jgi:hypothetical protein
MNNNLIELSKTNIFPTPFAGGKNSHKRSVSLAAAGTGSGGNIQLT